MNVMRRRISYDAGQEAAPAFQAFLKLLQTRIGAAAFNSWMGDLQLEEAIGDGVTLSTTSKFRRDSIEGRYAAHLFNAWTEAVGPIRRLDLVTRRELSTAAAKVNALAPTVGPVVKTDARAITPAPYGDFLASINERSTFDQFAVDESNRLAVVAARQIFNAVAPSETIYLYGPSGVGKTHLLHAVANEWAAQNGAGGCLYLSHNDMKESCVSAVMSKAVVAFQRTLLAQGVILIDDVHFLASSVRTQMEILNLVNAANAGGLRLVIAGELSPSGLVGLGFNERLADRLAGGLCASLASGGEALRRQVLTKRLAAMGMKCEVDEEAIAFIARHISQSMRETIGALLQIQLYYGEQTMRVGVEETKSALKDRLVAPRRRQATLLELAEAIVAAFAITMEQLVGKSRLKRFAQARHAFAYLAREVLHESFPKTGRFLGRDHTTAMSSYDRATALMTRDAQFQACLEDARARIGG